MSSRKTPPPVDPFAEREAQSYAHPIPSREFIMQQLAHMGKPLTLEKLAEVLHVTDKSLLEALRRRLKAMERDGQLIRNRRKEYGLAKKMNLVSGRVIGHRDGFGFLVPDDGGDDLYLSEREMRSLLHGDRILANIIGVDNRGRREGALVEILERNTHQVVGRFVKKQGITYVEPDNSRIRHIVLIPPRQRGGAKAGQIVVAKLLEQPTAEEPPVGKIIEVMGEQRAPGMEIEIAIRAHELPHLWPQTVLDEIDRFSDQVQPSDLESRDDLRHIPFVTIDGEDAHDFDDAVYCEPRGKGWRLLVAIADVAAYVKPNTALDEEALNRGNSVYFPSRAVPMLPEFLSNGLCSLKPQVDRLSLVCELLIDFYGRTRSARFIQAVIRSAARLTYTEVAAALAGDEQSFQYPEVLPHLHHLYSLYKLLLKRRTKRGALDFETVETRIIFDIHKKIEKIVPVVRNDAHRLIEEMMLAANVAAAEWLTTREMPILYRVHEGPNPDKFSDLHSFLGTLGLRLGGKNAPKPLDYAKLIDKIKSRPDARLIQTVLLRSLKLAVYSPENKGHFGLAYTVYTHFTSPIRRYPDLLTHRAIKHWLEGKPLKKFLHSASKMHSLGEHCSMTERRADEATRDAMSWLKCEYMLDKVGEVYDGLVTAVTAFGLFVELDGIFAEGLVHVTSLRNDYYHFDPIGQRLKGEFSGAVYRLSDRVRVRVTRVSLEQKKVDLELV